jgi:hypothetical protein
VVERSEPLRIGTFHVDATPSIGDPITYGEVEAVDDSLSCRGVVLLTDEAPIVLAAVDWIGNYNGAHDAWQFALANAAGTAPERVAVHALHQHEAPRFDADTETLLLAYGFEKWGVDPEFARTTIRRVAAAVRDAVGDVVEVTHVGTGAGTVEKVASNRQLLGPDGECVHVRFSSEESAEWRGAPEGLIDPQLDVVSFWNEEEPLAALSYYATHPQSYYRNGRVTCDFPGIARNRHERETGVFQVHFTGAAGNVTAGKYNDGSEERRGVLADRVADGMADAWANTERSPVSVDDVRWDVESVSLPPAEGLDAAELIADLQSDPRPDPARDLAWLRRCETGQTLDLTCLHLGQTDVLHMPAELFVEYQLAARRMCPDRTVAMAAYGDCGPTYVGTRAAYPKGGYEVGSSKVAPSVEDVLTPAMRSLLDAPNSDVTPSDLTDEKPFLER